MSLLPSTFVNGLKVLRGIAMFAPLNADGSYGTAMILSPSSDMTVSMATATTDYVSAESGVNEILDSTLTSLTRTGKLTCNNISDEIKALFLIAQPTEVAQASGTVTDEQTGQVTPNSAVILGGTTNSGSGVFGVSTVSVTVYEGTHAATRVNSHPYAVGDVYIPTSGNLHWYMVTVEGTSAASAPTIPTDGSSFADGTATVQDMGLIALTVSTDYEIDLNYGLITILATGAIATAYGNLPPAIVAAGKSFSLSVGYTRSAQDFSQVQTKSAANLEGKFYFFEQNPKGGNSNWYMPSCQLAPSGDFALKSGTNYGAMNFGLSFQTPPTGSAVYINGVPAAVA